MKPRLNVEDLCQAAAGILERHSSAVLVIFSLIFLGVTGLIGASKLMTADEIFTYYPAHQAEAGQVWSFFAEGLDTNTPIPTLLVHASMRLFGDNTLGLRAPVILGYWVMCLCLYAFVAFRSRKIYGMVAMLLPPITSAYFYATEARAYGIILGAASMALLCWQRATSPGSRRGWWLTVMTVSLALCASLHYVALALWIPLGCAEAVRIWERKRMDWPMLAVLAASAGSLAVFIPMMLLSRQNYLGGFWAKAGLGEIENTYRTILNLAFAPLLGGVVVWLLATKSQGGEPASPELTRAPLSERVLIGLLALMPLYIVPLMVAMGAFVVRYILFTLIGITIVLTLAAYRRARGNAVFAVFMVAVLGGWFLLKYPNVARHQMARSPELPFRQARPFEATRWMQAIERLPDLPVIITPAMFFVEFTHYSLPEVGKRAYYLDSIADAMRLEGADTGDRVLSYFRRRFPFQVPNYAEFTARQRKFLLCAETTNQTWVIEKLMEDKAQLQLLVRDSTFTLYQVTLPSP